MTLETTSLTYISFDEAAKPRDGEVMVDRWWVVHPDKGLAVHGEGALQCNTNGSLPQRLAKAYGAPHEVRFFPIAFVGNIPWRY
jgi:hypothetical protein